MMNLFRKDSTPAKFLTKLKNAIEDHPVANAVGAVASLGFMVASHIEAIVRDVPLTSQQELIIGALSVGAGLVFHRVTKEVNPFGSAEHREKFYGPEHNQ